MSDGSEMSIEVLSSTVRELTKRVEALEASAPKKRFKKPTVDEVREYIKLKKYSIDAEHFVNYYDVCNWMRGKTKIANWKLVLATWEKRSGKGGAKESADDWFKQTYGE